MVYLILANGFEEIEAISIVDIMRRAEIQIKTVSIMESKIVYGGHDIPVEADEKFDAVEFDRCNLVILPGGLEGTKNMINHKGLRNTLTNLREKGTPLAAICAAPMALAQFGLLKGKKATIYPSMEDELIGAKFTEGNIVHDEGITTSKGPGTAMEFALDLVRQLKGEDMAEKIAAGLLYQLK